LNRRRAAPLHSAQVEEVLRLAVSLREHAFWRLLLDSGAAAAQVLALDVDHQADQATRPGGARLDTAPAQCRAN
jgi:hypothetical protein